METRERAAPSDTKKSRIWNPALDLDEPPEKLTKEKLEGSPLPMPPFAPLMQPFLNLFLENYIQSIQPFAWRMQQFQQANKKIHENFKQKRGVTAAQQSDVEASTSATTNASIPNPLVASALGLPSQGIENSCAICGASFRLTTDLVAHMRSNHRMCRFKRKNEKL